MKTCWLEACCVIAYSSTDQLQTRMVFCQEARNVRSGKRERREGAQPYIREREREREIERERESKRIFRRGGEEVGLFTEVVGRGRHA